MRSQANTANTPHHIDVAGHAAALLRELRDAWTRHRRYARARAELAAYSDSELADIGITRADIDTAVETGRRTLA